MLYSTLATVIVAAFSFLSMGALGAGLSYLMSFVTQQWYPTFDDLHGDWVWPAMIMIGIYWSLAFLVGGLLNLYLLKQKVGLFWRNTTYVAIIVLWLLCLWIITLQTNGY